MKEQDIVEGNKLIAEFMEFDYERTLKWIENEDRPPHKSGRPRKMEVPLMVDDLEYHSSWDWLMPVIEKIESLWLNVSKCPPIAERIIKLPITTSKDEVWGAVIQFIQWYQQNQKPQ